MPQQAIELILTRQWASYLAMPVWVTGEDGNLLYYNEPAEALLGRRYDEAGEMPLDELSQIFQIATEDGSPIVLAAFPLAVALRRRRPAHERGQFRGLDGVWRKAEMTAFPLEGQGGRLLGAVALFWETEDGPSGRRIETRQAPARPAGGGTINKAGTHVAQKEVEIILTRHWSSQLVMPVWLMDTEGRLLFYNEPAEALLGQRFEEAGEILLEQVPSMFKTTAEDGSPLPPEDLPIGIALKEQRPAHMRLRYVALNGSWRLAEVTAFPIEGQGGRQLGVVAIFWEIRDPQAETGARR